MTVDLIKQYTDPRIVFVDLGLTRQGACLNFMSLLNVVESDYYMFCDQDDIWFEDKIQASYKRMIEEEKEHQNSPVLVYSDASRIDAKGNVILETEFNRKNWSKEKTRAILNERCTLNMLRLLTICAGCKMMFNHKTKEVAIPFCNLRYHDSIIAIAVAKNNGIFSPIIKPFMYYRIHQTNTCGVHETSIFNKLQSIKDTIHNRWRMFLLWQIYGGGTFLFFSIIN